MTNITTIKATSINVHAPTQLRLAKESQRHIEDLAHSYATYGRFNKEPVVAHVRETNEYVPIDGFHRVRAFLFLSSEEYTKTDDAAPVAHLDLENITVELVSYATMGEAIVAAAGVNAEHGLPRKRGDIKNAINALLGVDKERFMDGEFKLDRVAIMATVKCSKRSYEIETKEIRGQLESHRDLKIRMLASEGKTQREIANELSVGQATVSRVLPDSKTQDAQMNQEDTQGVPKTQDAQMGQSDTQGDSKTQDAQMNQEDPSVFTHITSAKVADNPWDDYETVSEEDTAGDDCPFSLDNGSTSETKANVEQSSDMTDDELCGLLAGLSAAQKELALRFLENL